MLTHRLAWLLFMCSIASMNVFADKTPIKLNSSTKFNEQTSSTNLNAAAPISHDGVNQGPAQTSSNNGTAITQQTQNTPANTTYYPNSVTQNTAATTNTVTPSPTVTQTQLNTTSVSNGILLNGSSENNQQPTSWTIAY